ncbi:MAG: GNAT family N-acetyltransferase [Chloroflexi bacterium]|nr:GNAT family N-acetyltransferase [Chloroflexota bacterium]MDA1003749.1 GNAT family N-acetyltransferase [Chloroflexota bacterium]
MRLATAADAEAIGETHVAAQRFAYRGVAPDRYLARLDPAARADQWRAYLLAPPESLRVWVVERERSLAGFCGTHEASADEPAGLPPRSAELHWIHLRPEHVGTGAGRALMARALADLAARGFRHAVLWVLDDNVRARRFYAAGGWSPDGTGRMRTFRVDEDAAPVVELRYARPLTGAETPCGATRA